ncbi:tubulin polyglutamylase TTLL5-like [Macrosteles quadrilineatus]|uniref:tubulin polyglutamylase TTLL5-like n=1 Tax=Macrosteles quadrilineatus TaxID=74068 RepID=UPI0023E2E792|nr:tubulin polyglutamylase TTLL5-like [Macrosteles quadrilineatus]
MPACVSSHLNCQTGDIWSDIVMALLMDAVPQDFTDFNLLWTGVHPKPQVLRSLSSHQRVNHFPRSYELTRKDRLYKNIEKMQHAKGVKHFDFIPQTFVMPGDFRELTTCHYRTRGPWIVKPVASSRGRGIYIVNSPDEVPLEESLVVAKYIENPLLVSGHKCDLRLYVAVTSYDPLMVYLYEEGLVRLATVKYDNNRKHLWNPCMHLCNYSINKHHSDYIKSEDPEAEDVGHKWTLSALLRHLKSLNYDTALLMQRIEEVIIKSLLATAPSIIAACKLFVPSYVNCFELYGFDILIDSELKPWLLEVNLSPSLGCDTPLDTRVKSALLVDLLTLVGLPAVDPVVRPPTRAHRPTTAPHLTTSRRVQSADSLPNVKHRVHSAPSHSHSLTAEETRVVRYAKAQYERRGGFIRIFPSAESWKRYSAYLDPVTGIPSVPPGTQWCVPPNHNINLTLHQQLFPDSITSLLPSVISAERLCRYERALSRGHRSSLDEAQHGTVTNDTQQDTQLDTRVLKQELVKCLNDGFKLSKIQARQAFGQYLQCVLGRMSGQRTKAKLRFDDGDSELILRFLQRASHNLRTAYHVKPPNRSLVGKDRVAIVAKNLSDFLYIYNRETESMSLPTDTNNFVPNRLFTLFLQVAKESDLEQILVLNTQLHKCAQVLLGQCGSPSAAKLQTQSLLHSISKPLNPHEKATFLDCDCNKKSFPQLLSGNKENVRSHPKVSRAL